MVIFHSGVKNFNISGTKFMCEFNIGIKWVQVFESLSYVQIMKMSSKNLFYMRGLRQYSERVLVTNLSMNSFA